MTIVGCDFHPGWQPVAVCDPETGEVQQLKLANGDGEAEGFYRRLPAPALVGIEACGNTQWFEDLLERGWDTSCGLGMQRRSGQLCA